MSNGDLSNIITKDEKILWEGKPKKGPYIFEKAFILLPFVFLWVLFDGFVISTLITTDAFEGMPIGMVIFIIVFFMMHLLPVWFWLGNVLTAKARWKNTKYALTDKRIIIHTGFIGMDIKTIYYKDIKNVHLNVGILDKLFKTGSVFFDTTGMGNLVTSVESSQASPRVFKNIENPYEIYSRIQKIVLDMQTDIEFPNAYRPEDNPGYKTKYKKK